MPHVPVMVLMEHLKLRYLLLVHRWTDSNHLASQNYPYLNTSLAVSQSQLREVFLNFEQQTT